MVVPKAGLYQRGLLKSLMDWAIPLSLLCGTLSISTLSLSLLVGRRLALSLFLTPY